MAANAKTVEKYLTTLMVLRQKLTAQEPVMQSKFAAEWGVTNALFTVLNREEFITKDTKNRWQWTGPMPTYDNVAAMLDRANKTLQRRTTPKPTVNQVDAQLKEFMVSVNERLDRIEKVLTQFAA